MIEQRKLEHVQVSTGDEEAFVEFIGKIIAAGRKAYCVPLNLTKYVVSKRDFKLRDTIHDADLVNADGVPIVWLARRHGFRDVFRITGVELAESLIRKSGERNWSIFILGAAPEIVSQAVENLRRKYPQAGILGFRDGYFKNNEIPAVITAINKIKPDILFLGLGMPQKEYFVHDHLKELNVRFCLPVGGAIDIWAGAKKRTPPWLQKIGMEWFYRSFYDFSRAWNIIKYGAVFLKDLVWIKR
jgi:N-acetylglucosaminyldiphosphoundecaprenol N-acetyl-beta-D-mannosaminyltransferase